MTTPQFPKSDEILSCEEVINAILTSIALEEIGLSHILNAEGEKIQYVLKHCADTRTVIEINESVSAVLDRVIDLQFILKNKMRLAEKLESKHMPKCCYRDKCSCKCDASTICHDECNRFRTRCDEDEFSCG